MNIDISNYGKIDYSPNVVRISEQLIQCEKRL